VHNIKASSDPSSTISKQNLVATCGQCHPGAGENFTKGSVHIALAQSTDALLYWVRLFYILLIVTVVGGMVVHNSLDFIKRSKRQIALRTGAIEPHAFGATQYLRMTLNERIQHATMLTSFIVLVLTGFMLRYPDAWWVASIRQISAKTFEFRGIIHRVAGVCMIGVSLYHAYYLAFNERGRRLVRDLMPKLQDMRDVWLLQLYNLGISKKRPRFGRFGYIEKAEYWALVWGVVIMGATGIILWFDNFFMNRLTKLGWDVARTVHFYEAVLATLAIVVWHFYYVIFNPSVYPMSTAWLTGKITEEEMADEHPLELERIREQETTEAADERR
jgi:cytochrome b subunit of formate dehydrogenase